MAHVFRARRVGGGPDVAIKVFRPELSSHLTEARFHREVRISEELEHPGIVPVVESGAADGLLYFVMPFVEGETLAQRLEREGSLPVEDALRITAEVGAALAHAHAAGYIHRDVKPTNIILGPSGAIVMDFGVAGAVASAAGDRLTLSGISVGTPRYMSPEQGAGDRKLDGRSDEYSLACVVFEMLVGEPPFTGPTAKAVIARHIAETAPSIRIVRPDIPPGVAWAVTRALRKNAADRFSTVSEFVISLSQPPPAGSGTGSKTRRGFAVLAAVALTAVIVVLMRPGPVLDDTRVLVFPPDDSAGVGGVSDPIATYIGYVLEGTDPLRWEEARDWIDGGTSVADLSHEERVSVARAAGAGYFIDGSVLRSPDSMLVILRLHDSATGELIERAGSSGPPDASEPRLGAIAVGALLVSIIEPGRRVDLGALAKRSPASIAQFYQGEVAYVNTRFDEALEHYSAAIDGDSLFAIAAVKGAQAAGWLEDDAEASRLAELAIRNDSMLPRKYRGFIRGVHHYHAGRSDSALVYLADTVSEFDDWAEGWTALGELYYHLMPDVTGLDSLAHASFMRAQQLDSTLAPPLYHLAEMAIREGALDDARTIVQRIESLTPDRLIATQLRLMTRCAESGPSSVPWQTIADTAEFGVLAAAQAMSPSSALQACAEGAARAVFELGGRRAWGALLVFQSLLLAQDRLPEVRALLASEPASNLGASVLLLIDAAADPRLAPAADSVYEARANDFAGKSSTVLWLLMEWAATSGRIDDLREITRSLERLAANGTRRDTLIAQAATVRLAAAEGDTDRALALLDELHPSAPVADLVWQPWEPLVPERLLRAELLLARDSVDAARSILAPPPSHRAVAELLFSPARTRLLGRLASLDPR